MKPPIATETAAEKQSFYKLRRERARAAVPCSRDNAQMRSCIGVGDWPS